MSTNKLIPSIVENIEIWIQPKFKYYSSVKLKLYITNVPTVKRKKNSLKINLKYSLFDFKGSAFVK